MTSKVNGKTEISTPCTSETPENIETKIVVNAYVMDPFNSASFCGNRSDKIAFGSYVGKVPTLQNDATLTSMTPWLASPA